MPSGTPGPPNASNCHFYERCVGHFFTRTDLAKAARQGFSPPVLTHNHFPAVIRHLPVTGTFLMKDFNKWRCTSSG
jgi:hypothetical protein